MAPEAAPATTWSISARVRGCPSRLRAMTSTTCMGDGQYTEFSDVQILNAQCTMLNAQRLVRPFLLGIEHWALDLPCQTSGHASWQRCGGFHADRWPLTAISPGWPALLGRGAPSERSCVN